MKEELQLRRVTPVFINSFNQPTYLRNIISCLQQNSFRNITVCDNASSSKNLLAYLEELEIADGVNVWRIGANIGPREAVCRITETNSEPFIFSDADIGLVNPLPDDFLTNLLNISFRFHCMKIGLALEIPTPDQSRDIRMKHPFLGDYSIQDWEKRFWEKEIATGIYRADVDTTFFLWNPRIKFDFRRKYKMFVKGLKSERLKSFFPKVKQVDIRVAEPGYVARHLPWYLDDIMPSSEREYYAEMAERWSTWVSKGG